ncbi:S8 family serine peptidase [Kordia sp.]|uniref:S8 family serine peptidase n=1 Tax=Kordia sp. TaxID=1965332 RepID=UPI003D2C05A9
MKLLKLVTLFSICYCIISCASVKSPKAVTFAISNKQPLTEKEKKDWYFKDIYKDSIPGISLHKAYDFLNNKKGDTIIVATIDLEVNISHKDLQSNIWVNTNEIPENGVDDDDNGYIDDIHGWNFLGTTEKDSVLYQHSESVRIIKKYEKLFEAKKISDIDSSQITKFRLYERATLELNNQVSQAEENIIYFKGFKERYFKLIDTMHVLFNTKEFTLEKLDSLDRVSTDSIVKTKISSTKYCLERGIDEKWINKVINLHSNRKFKIYNLKHKDRLTTDNPFNLAEVGYGNNKVRGTRKMSHGSKVAGVIAAIRNNNYGVNGINDEAKIMPIIVSTNGNEYDKDIALGIRYAVDNGAKIINMSIGKEFSMNEEWIIDAIKYAELNDVLLISSAGNESLNLDKKDVFYYPNDMNKDKNEISNNFIVVGSSNYKKGIVSDYSNYGKTTVDIFAPGENIRVITRKSYTTDSGTSISCAIVSGIASLIRSYYPNLTAKEVKDIILSSGTLVDANVYLPFTEGEERNPEKVPFSSLSKSGKIVNAYNALLMAEEVSKKKKKRK